MKIIVYRDSQASGDHGELEIFIRLKRGFENTTNYIEHLLIKIRIGMNILTRFRQWHIVLID